jgi:hypothetical protein
MPVCQRREAGDIVDQGLRIVIAHDQALDDPQPGRKPAQPAQLGGRDVAVQLDHIDPQCGGERGDVMAWLR